MSALKKKPSIKFQDDNADAGHADVIKQSTKRKSIQFEVEYAAFTSNKPASSVIIPDAAETTNRALEKAKYYTQRKEASTVTFTPAFTNSIRMCSDV